MPDAIFVCLTIDLVLCQVECMFPKVYKIEFIWCNIKG
jgi:hypothetical protein